MNTFLVIAALMAAIAAGTVAFPLIRDRQYRAMGAVVALMVMGAAAGLYPLWSNWKWHASAQSPANAGPDVLAMVAASAALTAAPRPPARCRGSAGSAGSCSRISP